MKTKFDEGGKGHTTVALSGRSPKDATYFYVYSVVQNLGTCSNLAAMEDEKMYSF